MCHFSCLCFLLIIIVIIIITVIIIIITIIFFLLKIKIHNLSHIKYKRNIQKGIHMKENQNVAALSKARLLAYKGRTYSI